MKNNSNNNNLNRGLVYITLMLIILVGAAIVCSGCSLFSSEKPEPIITSASDTTTSPTQSTTTQPDTDPDNKGDEGNEDGKDNEGSDDPATTTKNDEEPDVTTGITTDVTTEAPVIVPQPEPEPMLYQFGDKGDEVKKMQARLIELGWLNDVADGAFGAKTQKAVSVFQRYNSLSVTGYAYQSMLDALYAEDAMQAPVTYDHEDVKDPDYKSEYYIIVYNQNCRVLVLKKDDFGKYSIPVKTFICSVGIFEEDTRTPEGVHSIDKRYEWRTLFGDEEHKYVYGQYTVRFNGNYLFHSVPYYKQAYDQLEMDEFEKLGTPASKGCVRLCVRDAKWIYDNAENKTQVRVMDGKDGPAEYEYVPPLSTDPIYKGWDPTDPNPDNPYNKKNEEDSDQLALEQIQG